MPKIARRPARPVAPPPKAAAKPRPVKREAAPVVEEPKRPEVRAGGREVMCRSCGIRPGRPTAIIGQLTATELCDVCAALRKERIRQNRAMARGYRI